MNAMAVHEGFVPAGRNRLPQVLLAGFVVVWVLAAIKPLYWQDWFLENLLVFAIVPVLVGTYRRFRFSNASYLLIALFLKRLCATLLGAT